MHFYGYYVLSINPTILSYVGTMFATPTWLKPIAVMEHIPWWHGQFRKMVPRKFQQLSLARMGIDHHLIVHAEDENILRQSLRVKGAKLSQNVYLNQEIYKPIVAPKIYDALYVAQLKKFKRHHLAADIESLYIVTGEDGSKSELCSAVQHATFSKNRLSKLEMAELFNQSHCSLALSAIEGGMLASFESLLCGIPVVSTPSKGGRDEFFNAGNSIVVDPVASEVAKGVIELKNRHIEPGEIHSDALVMLRQQRESFCSYVSTLIVKHGGKKHSGERLYDTYFNHPEGINSRFIWKDRFDDPSECERFMSLPI